MNSGTMEQCTEGMKKQARELIEQAYQRGYKAGVESCADAIGQVCDDAKNDGITEGRNEAWETARKIVLQSESGWDYDTLQELFGFRYVSDILRDLTATEAIEKIRAYENQKKQEEDERIKVGDEVKKVSNGIKGIVIKVADEETNNHVVFEDGSEWLSDFVIRKTGRHFPEIEEVLKKMQEGKE